MPDSSAPKLPVEFGDFRFDRTRRLLYRNGQEVHVTAKALDCLAALLERSNRVVTRAELMETVWPDTYVEDSNLTQNISVLRRALGEGAKDHRYIVTIPGRGYRFVGSVVSDGATEPGRSGGASKSPTTSAGRQILLAATVLALLFLTLLWWLFSANPGPPALTGRAAPTRLAILPFDVLGADSDDSEVLGVGMADAVIHRLNRIETLTVKPTAAVRRLDPHLVEDPLAAGAELEVEAVLTGTVVRSGERLRVTSQLLRLDGGAIWAGRFEQRYTDLFAVLDAMSLELARALTDELSGEVRRRLGDSTTNALGAWEAYLRGRLHLSKRTGESIRRGITEFEDALVIDPAYAMPWLGLADAYLLQALYETTGEPPRGLLERSRAAAAKALEIDDSVSDAHATLAYLLYQLDHDFLASEDTFREAIALAPGSPRGHQWYGWLLLATDRAEAARAELERARELDPLSLIRTTAVGMQSYYTGNHDRAEEMIRAALEIDRDFGRAHLDLGLVLEAQGRYSKALTQLERAEDLLGDSSESLAAIGHLAGVSGDRARWQEAIAELRRRATTRYVSPYRFAVLHAAVGDVEAAITALGQSLADRSAWPIDVLWDPRLEPIRDDDRYRDLVTRMLG